MGKVKTPKARALPDYPRGLTFEKVWAALMEDREQSRQNAAEHAERQREYAEQQRELVEQQKETDRIAKETAKRHEKAMEETAKRHEKAMEEAAKRHEKAMEEAAKRHEELDRIVKENAKYQKEISRELGSLGNRYGEMIEYMVKPNLVDKFRELGFMFTKVNHDTSIKDIQNNILAQIDFSLEAGDKVMIVEVKSKPIIRDVKDHIEHMKKVRLHASLHDDKRNYFGAVAGMVIKDNVRDFILKSGFYVIEPSGETFTITPPGNCA